MPTPNSQNNGSAKPTVDISTPSSNYFVRAVNKFPLLTIVLALLVPPLGLVAAIAGMKSIIPRKATVVTSLLAASVLGALVYITLGTGWININGGGVTKYNYQAANNNKYPIVQAGGMSFPKPSEFAQTAKANTPNYSTASFVHMDSYKYPLSYIFAFSYKDSHASDDKYVKGVNDFMTGTVKNSYSVQYIDAIKKQVFDSYPGYNATLGMPQKFTNANIKKNAWSFDLDVTNSNPQVLPMKGKLVYVLGPGVIYYFSLMVTNEDWAPNMATWQAILGGLSLGV